MGLAKRRQSGLKQSVVQGEGRFVCRKWILFRDGGQPARQILVPGIFPFGQGELPVASLVF